MKRCDLCDRFGGNGRLLAVKHPMRGWERPGYGGLTRCDAPVKELPGTYIAGWGFCRQGYVPCPACSTPILGGKA